MGLEIFERGELPRWAPLRQNLDATDVGDIAATVAAELARPETGSTILPGQRVALTAGSRGIDKIDQVLKALVDAVRRLGADPFIVPAMGSHGGATADGQRELIGHYGITEAAMGCPIRSSMETVRLGNVRDDVPVYFDRHAYEADAVIPVGRVKPHTDFRGPVESGLMKMIAIGLGKQHGAEFFHAQGMHEFGWLIPLVANFSLSKVNIPFGVALIENGHGLLSQIEAVPAARIWDRERELLTIARERMGRLPGREIDVLIVDKIGKDISGDGADPNVINRDVVGMISGADEPPLPAIQRLIFRDLTEDTEGNATGIGMADVVLAQAVAKIDPVATYMNMITAKAPQGARVPLTVATDRQALYVAIACCLKTSTETAKIARIPDTKHVESIWASEPLMPDLVASGRVEQTGEMRPIAFDAAGMFAAQTTP
ncbi:MAG: lactate racemase domain-containing protein [Chloroflexota bacterium]|nr:lactate racemase domain-containing protein [Chloroflexota bacterium]